MAPIVNGLKPQYDDTVAIRMYNVESSDAGNELAQEYGIQFVPSFVFVDGEGNYVNTIIGEISESGLKAELDKLQ